MSTFSKPRQLALALAALASVAAAFLGWHPTQPARYDVTAQATAQTPAAAPAGDRYPDLGFALLEPAERTRFVAIAAAELCPCEGVVSSLDECLQKPDVRCHLAEDSAGLMMRWIKEKSSDAEITDKLQQSIQNARKVYTFDVAGRPATGASAAQAKVTLVEFFDFECPHCKAISEVVDRLVASHNDTLRVVHKQFPLEAHRNAPKAAVAAMAAQRQGKYWEFYHGVFAAQEEIQSSTDPTPIFDRIATEIGLNIKKFHDDQALPEVGAMVAKDREEGLAANIDGTPTFYLNGVKIMDMRTESDLVRLVDAKVAAAAGGH